VAAVPVAAPALHLEDQLDVRDDMTNNDPATDSHDDYRTRIHRARRSKDEFFARSHQSPLAHDRRHAFIGLAYFPPDVSYRLPGLRPERIAGLDGAPFLIDTSDDRPRTAHRLGRLRFRLAGRQLALTAYNVGEAASDSLFVPFRDATSGTETYGAGRYLDLQPDGDGTYTLDFNLAYQPYCLYAETYSCPLPPEENHLPIRVEAGERLGEIFREGAAGEQGASHGHRAP
jgi:uncharacterized protein (DUF1684 family)